MRKYARTLITHVFETVDSVGKVIETQQTQPAVYLVWTEAAALASVQDFTDTLKAEGLTDDSDSLHK